MTMLFLLPSLLAVLPSFLPLVAMWWQTAADLTPPGIPAWLWAVLGVLGAFLMNQVWPYLTKTLFPQLAKERERAERIDREQEERLLKLIERNTEVLSGLKTTIEQVNDQLGRQSEVIHALSLDVAALYGHLQTPRPSAAARRKPVPVEGA